jgi:hypothetical protein
MRWPVGIADKEGYQPWSQIHRGGLCVATVTAAAAAAAAAAGCC